MLLSQFGAARAYSLAFLLLAGVYLLVNKAVVTALPRPRFVVLVQLLFSTVAAWRGKSKGQLAHLLTHSRVKEAAPLAGSYLMVLLTASSALTHVNVDMLVAVQACTPAAVAVAEWAFLQTGSPPRWAHTSAVVLLSAAALSPQLASTSIAGQVYLAAWFLSFVFYTSLSTYIAKQAKQPTMDKVLHESILSSAPCLLLVLATDIPTASELAQLNGGSCMLLVACCILCFTISYIGWALREAASSAGAVASLNVLSKLITVGINSSIWDNHGPALASLLLAIALVVASLSSAQHQGKHRQQNGDTEEGETKGKGSHNPLRFWWGVVGTAAVVAGLLWVAAAGTNTVLHSESQPIVKSRAALEQELSLVQSELQQLRNQAAKLEQEVVHKAQRLEQKLEQQLTQDVVLGAGLLPDSHANATASSSTSSSSSTNNTSSASANSSTEVTSNAIATAAGTEDGGADDYITRLRKAAERPIRVVFMTGLFWSYHPRLAENCSLDGVPLKCDFSSATDEKTLDQADCLYYHVPSFSGVPRPKAFANQLRLGMSLESATYYKQLDNPSFMCQFDAEMTYRQCAQVVNWYSLEMFDELYRRPVVPFEDKLHSLVYINSNCAAASGRSEIMRELMQLPTPKVPVHSFGACNRNKPWPEGNPNKREVMTKYKFCVTMENSLAYDYVTEKMWDGLAAGCVPIYLGSASALNMIPDTSGVILYDPKGNGHASTPQELDALMDKIGNDKGLYESMVAWKQRTVEDQPSELFKYLWKVRHTTGECFLCQFLARHRVNPQPHYTTCLFNKTWMAAAGQQYVPQPGCND